MINHPFLDQGLSILQARLQAAVKSGIGARAVVQPFVTLSRETGAGATALGRALVPLLDRELGEKGRGWVFLDKDLLASALTHHNLPTRLAAFLPEDRVSEIQAVIGELVGLHPPLWELKQKVAKAILQLAHAGRVIFAGRAAHIATRGLPGGLHVRLVASRDVRVQRIQALLQCDEDTAVNHVEKSDAGRRRFLRANFASKIDDPHLYDLVVNTDRISPQAAARIVCGALKDRLESLQENEQVFGAPIHSKIARLA